MDETELMTTSSSDEENTISQKDPLAEETKKIQDYLRIDARAATDFARQVLRLRDISKLFQEGEIFHEDKDREINRLFENAEKSLEYEKNSYQIAFVGATSSGKSTLINALLGGRPLSKALGAASVTGTLIKIFFHDEPEKVVVTSRQADDILDLVKRGMIDEFGMDKTLPSELNEDFANQIKSWQSPDTLSEKQRHRFDRTRSSLIDIINHYLEEVSHKDAAFHFIFPEKNISTQFTHDSENQFSAPFNPDVEEYLLCLVDENSDLNKTKHRIGLVQSVAYYVNPVVQQDSQNQLQLSLPQHVCLVDLPGFNPDKPLHDIIFVQGIEKASVAVLVLRPDPPQEKGAHMYELVKKHVTPDNTFLVVNRWDQLPHKDPEETKRFTSILDEVKEDLKLYEYFKVVASVAYDAQLGLQGKENLIKDTTAYEKSLHTFGIRNFDDYEAALQKSGVPKLFNELTRFINTRFLVSQKLSGKNALDDICRMLFSKYPSIPENDLDTLRNVNDYLQECLEDIEQVIAKFHLQKMQTDNLQAKLEREVNNICESIDLHLKQKLPEFWKECFDTKPDVHFLGRGGIKVKRDAMWLVFLDKLQFEIWKQLSEDSDYMQNLSRIVIDEYKDGIDVELSDAILNQVASLVPLSEEERDNIVGEVQVGTDDIYKRLETFCRHVVLSKATYEHISLTANATINESLEKPLAELAGLDDKLLPSDRFIHLIKVNRDFYKKALTPHTLDDIVHLYEYLAAFNHNRLVENLKRFFMKLKKKAGTDQDLALSIIEAHKFPNLEQRSSVAEKRKAIKQFCERKDDET